MEPEAKKDAIKSFENILNMIPFGIILVSNKEKIDYSNTKFASLFGDGSMTFTNLSQWLNIVFPDADYRRQIRSILLYEIPYTQTGDKRIYTAAIFTPAKEEKFIQLTSLHIAKDQFLIVCEDVTEARRSEAQLQQAQKLEAIGSMAGGVAHEINNILMGIQGYVSLMLLETTPADQHYHKLKAIEEQVNSGSDLTEQLLECARGSRFEPKTIDPNEFAASVTLSFSNPFHDLRINERYSSYVWAVEADTAQLSQAFQNIFSNAAKLLGGRGSLTLKTENIMLDSEDVVKHGIRSGPYVRFSLTVPEGHLTKSDLARLFSPPYVLKDSNTPTGLGLASTYAIIKTHGGMIDVTDHSEQGTVFHVFLPASSKTPHKKKPDSPAPVGRRGNETILLVDDEKVVTDVTGAMLTSMGYNVITASDGEDAVVIYQEKGASIDLIIMDIVMPGMGGGEAIDLIREINPNVKVILCSGYSMSGAVKAIMDKGVRTFLKKPFTMNDFTQKIREVLEN